MNDIEPFKELQRFQFKVALATPAKRTLAQLKLILKEIYLTRVN